MREDNGLDGGCGLGAEGGTFSHGETEQPKQAAPGRFPEGPCQNMANGLRASGASGGTRQASDVQSERNATPGGEVCAMPGCVALASDVCAVAPELFGRLCGEHAAASREDIEDARRDQWRSRRELVPMSAALDAAARWARDWLDVFGQPSALWELVLRFAALVAMRPGELRRLDEAHTLRLVDQDASAVIWAAEPGSPRLNPLAYVTPLVVQRYGHTLSESELAELGALLRGAIQRVEALQEEAELFRHAAGLIRGDGLVYRWTTGADLRDAADVPLDAPHPDAVVFSLPGALRQAWAERGGSGQVPLPTLKRLVQVAAPRCFTFKAEPTADACLDVLRIVNGQAKDGASMLELLIAAALDAEAESEVR